MGTIPTLGGKYVCVKSVCSQEQTNPQKWARRESVELQVCFSVLTSTRYLSVGQVFNISETQPLVKVEVMVPTSQ